MPFRSRLHTILEGSPSPKKTHIRTYTRKIPFPKLAPKPAPKPAPKITQKLKKIQSRYSHIAIHPRNANTLYRPTHSLPRTKKQVNPKGNSWNLLLRELNKPVPKRKSTLPKVPFRPRIPRLAKLYFPRSTEQENLNRLQRELNKPFSRKQ